MRGGPDSGRARAAPSSRADSRGVCAFSRVAPSAQPSSRFPHTYAYEVQFGSPGVMGDPGKLLQSSVSEALLVPQIGQRFPSSPRAGWGEGSRVIGIAEGDDEVARHLGWIAE